jgi:HEAT repeat protein
LGDSVPYVRLPAAEALWKIEGPTDEVMAVLIRAVRERDYRTDWWVSDAHTAIGLIGEIGPAAKDAVPALREAFRDTRFPHRERAAWALGRIGPAARDTIPDLRAALLGIRRADEEGSGPATHDDIFVNYVAKALKQIDPESAARAAKP